MDELFLAVFEFLQVFDDIGIEVEFAGVRQGCVEYMLELVHVNVVVLDDENQIIGIRIQTVIQFA